MMTGKFLHGLRNSSVKEKTFFDVACEFGTKGRKRRSDEDYEENVNALINALKKRSLCYMYIVIKQYHAYFHYRSS